jgi:alpha-L-fucosidase
MNYRQYNHLNGIHKHQQFMNKINVSILLIIVQSCFLFAQNNDVRISNNNFEQNLVNPWLGLGGDIKITTEVFHGGKQSLEITSGATAQIEVDLKPKARYTLSAWVRTSSGSDEIQLNLSGLGSNNVSTISTLADWVEIEKSFVTDEGQKRASIEVFHPANSAKLSTFADDIQIEYLGEYIPEKPSGIKPLSVRKVRMELGITQQPNDKLDWLIEARFGMFIHWGLYSGVGKGEWYMENSGTSPEEYRKLAYPQSGNQYFDAIQFNAEEWAKLAKDAGMKYMNMVTQHHDGYALFDSKYMNVFCSKQTHNRDFVKEYVDACRGNGLKVGIYKTLINWRYPGYYDVVGTNCKPNRYGYKTDIAHKENARLMKEEMYCLTKELLTKYGKIDQIYWDGGWLAQQGSDADGAYFWESGKFLNPDNEWKINFYFQDIDSVTGKPLGLMGMARKYQPDCIVNPRTGWYGDYKSEEGSSAITGQIRTEDIYEKNMTMAPGWGYTPMHDDSSKVISAGGVKRMLVDCTIRNMAFLLNVGPDRHGKISQTETKVLLETGKWLQQTGEAIYGTYGGPWQPKDGQYGYAYKNKTIYLFLLQDFKEATFVLPSVNEGQKVVKASMVDTKKQIKAHQNANREITLSGFDKPADQIAIIAIELNKNIMENSK